MLRISFLALFVTASSVEFLFENNNASSSSMWQCVHNVEGIKFQHRIGLSAQAPAPGEKSPARPSAGGMNISTNSVPIPEHLDWGMEGAYSRMAIAERTNLCEEGQQHRVATHEEAVKMDRQRKVKQWLEAKKAASAKAAADAEEAAVEAAAAAEAAALDEHYDRMSAARISANAAEYRAAARAAAKRHEDFVRAADRAGDMCMGGTALCAALACMGPQNAGVVVGGLIVAIPCFLNQRNH